MKLGHSHAAPRQALHGIDRIVAIVASGVQGFYLHARGIGQKPGGWSNARYNLEMGPPLLAPRC